MPLSRGFIGPPKSATSRFWSSYFPATSGTLMTSQRLYASPYVVYRPQLVTSMNLEIAIAGSSTTGAFPAALRFGIYADTGTGMPGNLVVEAGTFTSTAAATATVATTQVLSPGQYWLAVVSQGAAVTQPNVRMSAATAAADLSLASVATQFASGYRSASDNTTGSLPSSYGAPGGDAAGVPKIFLGT